MDSFSYLRDLVVYQTRRLFDAIAERCSTYLTRFVAACLGIHLGRGVCFVGMPRFCRVPHATITLGNGCCLRSTEESNPAAAMRPCKISALTPSAHITIGHRVGMSAVTLVAYEGITIGDDVLIGAATSIYDCDFHNLHYSPDSGRPNNVPTRPVTIARGAFIGAQCIVLKGVTIGEGAVIGAGSVVRTSIPPYAVAAGNPCTVIHYLSH